MKSFNISIMVNNKKYRMMVTQKDTTDKMERYEVRANNHIFLFDCNRPTLVKKNLDHLPWEWVMVAGENKSPWFLDEIKKEMEKTLRQIYWQERKK